MRTVPTTCCGFLILSVYLAGCNSGYKSKPLSAAQISISATGAMAGSPDFTLTITGSNGLFYNSSHAVWFVNGTDNVLPTTFVSNTMLTAVVPAALLSNPLQPRCPWKRGTLRDPRCCQTQSFLTLRQGHRDLRFGSRL